MYRYIYFTWDLNSLNLFLSLMDPMAWKPLARKAYFSSSAELYSDTAAFRES